MSVNLDDVGRVAKLAKLQFSEDEKKALTEDLNKIFTWIDQLNQADTQDIEPLIGVSVDQMPLRADDIKAGGVADAVTQNAPASKFNMFSVPKVME